MMRMYTKRAVVRRINVAGLAITLYTLIMISWMYAIPKDGASMRWKVALVAVFVLAFACGFVLRYAGSFKSLKRICFLSEKNIVDFYMTDDLYALDADLRKVSHMFIHLGGKLFGALLRSRFCPMSPVCRNMSMRIMAARNLSIAPLFETSLRGRLRMLRSTLQYGFLSREGYD